MPLTHFPLKGVLGVKGVLGAPRAQWLQFWDLFGARARGAPRTPFTLRTPFKGNLLLYKVASPGKTPVKTESMLDWPLYTPSPNRECLYKVASPGKTPEKTESMLDWPLYTPSPNRECLYKVASPGKTPVQKPLKKQNLCWTGHFIPPPPTENASIKWPVQVKPLKKQNLCWTGHFIPPPPTENASIKWPVQVKPLKKHIFTWNGHFIPQPVGSRTLTRKRKDWQQGKGGKLQRRGTTGRLPQENETCHVYIRLLFSMCHIDWRWLVYWICCRCILEHIPYTYDSHININIYKS